MPSVTFYIMDEDEQAESNAQLQLACQLAANAYSSKKSCWVLCNDKAQAEQFDELLWQLPADRFVPHNLSQEGPKNGTPVEIIWQQPQFGGKAVLINLSSNMPNLGQQSQHIFDFVPTEETLKQQARERYKHYRAAGCQLDTQPAKQINESHDG